MDVFPKVWARSYASRPSLGRDLNTTHGLIVSFRARATSWSTKPDVPESCVKNWTFIPIFHPKNVAETSQNASLIVLWQRFEWLTCSFFFKVAITSVRRCWTKRRWIWREKMRNANARRTRTPASFPGKTILQDNITDSHEVIIRAFVIFWLSRVHFLVSGNGSNVDWNLSKNHF